MQPPTAFRQSADIPETPRLYTLLRRVFRQPPLHEGVSAQAAHDAQVFPPTEEGSGDFGRWIIDEAGLPAYQYEMDQYLDPRAVYPTTEGIDRRDHWHQVGNHRITALASNEGLVQVYFGDRGGAFLNRFEAWAYQRPAYRLRLWVSRVARWLLDKLIGLLQPNAGFTVLLAQQATPAEHLPPRGAATPEALAQFRTQSAGAQTINRSDPAATPYAYAGGYSYLSDGSATWASAYRYKPGGAHTRRVFGMGYFLTETTHRHVQVTRRVVAPHGDHPFLLAEVTLENQSERPVELRHYEYWDVNYHQVELEWVRSGDFSRLSDEQRRALRQQFEETLRWDQRAFALRFGQHARRPPVTSADQPTTADWFPPDVFLADLDGQPNGLYVDKARFFGKGGAAAPDAVTSRRPGDALDSESGAGWCLVMRRDVRLEAGERRTLRYAYGTVPPNSPLDMLDPFRATPAADTLRPWQDELIYFSTGEDPVLQREMAWHSYNLSSATVYNAFHGTFLVPQGSAYLYLHGADGAPRDQALFVVPMTYLNPAVARDMLRLIMRLTDGQTGQISYSFAGNGMVSDGLGIHSRPSDLDIFFLLACAEYLAATGDTAFLDESVPFYPPGQPATISAGTTVRDHIRVAVRHLFETTGIGDHGLIKVGSGDWSDSVVLETALNDGPGPFGVTYLNSKTHGESIPNTQMVLYVLPLLVDLLGDDAQAADIQARLPGLRQAAANQWNAKGWFNRAILRDVHNRPVLLDHFTLEAQPWALIGDSAGEHTAALIERVEQVLDRPSPIGCSLTAGGMVWPAVSQLMTWAYAHTGRDALAWRSLNRNTFAMHSTIYPHLWLNTWSGPDGINGIASSQAGWTWHSPLTPMTDFPVMNANQDAMALLGLLRVCGVEPMPGGLRIRPHVPRQRFTLDMPLLRLEVEPGRISGEYRAHNSGRITLDLPPGSARLDGQPVATTPDAARLTLVFERGQSIRFDVQLGEG